ncbi:unnamed protein product [Heligmosomoides polygyrus]|uniref:MIR domain-containing protein n=1 Tax=Heligmosomoides polygyrus TaxID=6339 RepID=A0A3P8EPF2_HELPZ|nr:unnamed protein product [Heligmosomoides polygyrus]
MWNSSDGNPFRDNVYRVQHREVFKSPIKEDALPSNINSPSTEAACGVHLEIGRQYLLAGSHISNGTYSTFRCGQIVEDGGNNSTDFGMPTEWDQVPEQMKALYTNTSISRLVCEVHLQVGKEYLLAVAGAMRTNGYFYTFQCSPIVDGAAFLQNDHGMSLEWSYVPPEAKAALILSDINCPADRDGHE